MSPAAIRSSAFAAFLFTLTFAQVRESLHPDHAARLEIVVESAGERVPARVYLFRRGRPFRLSPVDAMLPLRADLFYRERLWRRNSPVKTLEVTARDASHFILLDGSGTFDLPADNDYRVEAYHGTFYRPATVELELEAGEAKRVVLEVEPLASERQARWISADDHIHLMRAKEDDEIFLRWMAAEDLNVGNWLELQRQQHAAVQYGFGDGGAAQQGSQEIRSGHESRSRFYGHTLFLGGRRMIRPLSIGSEYANSPEAYPYPIELFEQGRREGALTGFAHFYGSQPNSTLLMNLVHGTIDFVELFQFGVLRTAEWYELLNAGFRVVGLAGSDFPANIGRFPSWPRVLPLLGPERALTPVGRGETPYQAWDRGVREGRVLLTNGPLLEFSVNDQGPGDEVRWDGDSLRVQGATTAIFHRPIESLEIVRNGEVIARQAGDGRRTSITLDFEAELGESCWLAARTVARSSEPEPPLQAHTNPAYFLKQGAPVRVDSARRSLRQRWAAEAAYYRSGDLKFSTAAQREGLLRRVDAATRALAR